MLGKKDKKVQIFFKVESVLGTLYLIKKQLEHCKTKKVSLTTKVKDSEHIKWVSFFRGINNKIGLVR